MWKGPCAGSEGTPRSSADIDGFKSTRSHQKSPKNYFLVSSLTEIQTMNYCKDLCCDTGIASLFSAALTSYNNIKFDIF